MMAAGHSKPCLRIRLPICGSESLFPQSFKRELGKCTAVPDTLILCAPRGGERPGTLGSTNPRPRRRQALRWGALCPATRNPRRPTRAHPCLTREPLTSPRQLPSQ